MRNTKVLGVSVVILIILFVMIVLINIRKPEIPEKPVFIIKDPLSLPTFTLSPLSAKEVNGKELIITRNNTPVIAK